MTLPDTLIVNGTDLRTLPWLVVENLDGLHAPGRLRGSDLPITGRRGQVEQPKVVDAYSFDVPVTLLGVDGTGNYDLDDQTRRAQYLTNLRALVTALGTGASVPLTRRLATATGYDEHACTGYYADGLAPTMLNHFNGKTTLQFVNLDGCWYDATATALTLPGTVTVPGTIPTRRLTIDLPGAGTLTNSTTGAAVTVSAATTLDVEALTSTAGLAAVTSWSGDDYWMVCAAGANTFTWSGTGSVTLNAKGAYL